jgi:MoaA/NifB/PqqE/SkfB family radical SAM enzyme
MALIASIPFHKNYYLKRFGCAINPSAVVFDITYRCNLRCQHCSIPHLQAINRNELDTDEIIRFLNSYAESHVQKPYISLGGGEPLLKEGFEKIIHTLDKNNYTWGVVTNGSVHDRSILHSLISSRADIVRISIDGMREVHDEMRQEAGSFSKAVSFIETMIANKRRTRAVFSITQKNMNDILPVCECITSLGAEIQLSLVSYCTEKEKEESERFISELYRIPKPASTVIHIKDESLTTVDTKKLFQILKGVRNKRWQKRVIISPDLNEAQLGDYFSNGEGDRSKRNCYFPWFNVRINPYGDIHACRVINAPLGNIKSDDLDTVYNSTHFQKVRQKLNSQRFSACKRCAYNNGRMTRGTLVDRIRNKYF